MNSTWIVVDLGFGDAGKGSIVDALARKTSAPPLVVRYNGGAQAGHNVHLPDGRKHTFSQFGAGSFVPGSRTLLSRFFLFHPPAFEAEGEHLSSLGFPRVWERAMVDGRALVITPYHQSANRLRELSRGAYRHGTCGMGIGETMSDSLECPEESVRVADLIFPEVLRRKFEFFRLRKQEQIAPFLGALVGIEEATEDLRVLADDGWVDEAVRKYAQIGSNLRILTPRQADFQIRESAHVIFEGAQGVLLDEWRGFHPHTTWSTTTTANAETLIRESGREGEVSRLGVVRCYATRHGVGPLPTEDSTLTQEIRDLDNTDTGWQGTFRVGWLDLPLLRYALSVCPVTDLAVTCLDQMEKAEREDWFVCDRYESGESDRFEREGEWGLAKTIRPGPFQDLSYQESLTSDLDEVLCVLKNVPKSPEGFLREIEGGLGVKVLVSSFGPTSEDKKFSGDPRFEE